MGERRRVFWGILRGGKRHAWVMPIGTGDRPACGMPVRGDDFPRAPMIVSPALRCRRCLRATWTMRVEELTRGGDDG